MSAQCRQSTLNRLFPRSRISVVTAEHGRHRNGLARLDAGLATATAGAAPRARSRANAAAVLSPEEPPTTHRRSLASAVPGHVKQAARKNRQRQPLEAEQTTCQAACQESAIERTGDHRLSFQQSRAAVSLPTPSISCASCFAVRIKPLSDRKKGRRGRSPRYTAPQRARPPFPDTGAAPRYSNSRGAQPFQKKR